MGTRIPPAVAIIVIVALLAVVVGAYVVWFRQPAPLGPPMKGGPGAKAGRLGKGGAGGPGLQSPETTEEKGKGAPGEQAGDAEEETATEGPPAAKGATSGDEEPRRDHQDGGP
jgi:hypothetical protein